jgi:phosphoglycolate phosphatase
LKQEVENIIWDWNGTLLDDAWLGVEIINELLNDRNLPGLSLEKYREVFDFPVSDYYARIGFDFSKEPFEHIGNEFIAKYNEKHFECKLKPYAYESLLKFQRSGCKQFVLSARNHNQLENEFKFHKIDHFFENFAGLPDNWANGKAELGMELIRTQQIKPDKTLMIGDTVHDYEVAKHLDLNCILVEGGHQSLNRLKRTNARILRNLMEL